MTLLDDLIHRSEVAKGPACKLKVWLDGLDPKLQQQIEQAFQDRRVLHRVLADWITEQPDAPKVTASNISHHRTGGCANCKRGDLNLTRPS